MKGQTLVLFTGLFNDEDMECCTMRQERVQTLGLQTSGVSHPGGSNVQQLTYGKLVRVGGT